MMRLLRLAFLFLSLCGLPTAQAVELEAFGGQWRGVSIESNDGFEVTTEDLFVNIKPAGGGFELEWKTPGGDVEQADFVESENKPGVFSTRVSSGGLLGFFSSSEGVNPLEGDPFTWARLDGESLIVYKLVIDKQGAFTLDRYENTLQNDAIRLRFTRRSHGESEQALVAQLQRGGN